MIGTLKTERFCQKSFSKNSSVFENLEEINFLLHFLLFYRKTTKAIFSKWLRHLKPNIFAKEKISVFNFNFERNFLNSNLNYFKLKLTRNFSKLVFRFLF